MTTAWHGLRYDHSKKAVRLSHIRMCLCVLCVRGKPLLLSFLLMSSSSLRVTKLLVTADNPTTSVDRCLMRTSRWAVGRGFADSVLQIAQSFRAMSAAVPALGSQSSPPEGCAERLPKEPTSRIKPQNRCLTFALLLFLLCRVCQFAANVAIT